MEELTALQSWLSFASTLIWQILVIVVLFAFRREIAALFERLARFKVGEAEFTFQPEASEATTPGGEAEDQIKLLGPGGFFTQEGIARLINKSDLVDSGERVVGQMLLFQTDRQHTWLVTTNKRLFCVLDDEDTRASGRLIQWRLPLNEAAPVKARPYKPGVGLVDIGPRRNWLYSHTRHPDRTDLEKEIKELLDRARYGSA